ncbi:hypothetical protein BDW42DRAFT_190431 [Aspergillus taichungensis]|uniref:Uncharacterized protein n=1 Tax=Aspergillus taichungensis TaxID=482145 RepID=A0A2J5I7F4_9EURO|nr:hypothetical protein BDW42DRAFT_190431 [Aspergillus taichungensis]
MALTMTPIMRQPFANLETPRVRSLMRSHLNRQPAKRAPLGDLALDAENVDPTRNAIKRKRGADDNDDDAKPFLKPSKTSRIALSTIPKTTTPTPTPITTPIKPRTTPSKPILKPAGRSPVKSTPRSSAHRRANVSKRPDQRSRVSRPFSLAAALAGPQKPASKKSTPPSWTFDIHVDSEQEEMTNLMQHSTTVLDIGCDDSITTATRATSPSDARGKENIPPAELEVDSAPAREPALSRKDAMEDARAPLGDLPASDYYGKDCHAFSYAVVYDDEDENLPQEKVEEKKKHTRSKLSSVSSVESIVESAPEEKNPAIADDDNKADAAATGPAQADS